MSTLDMVHPPVVLPSLAEVNTDRRLIVLVPDAEADYTPAVQRIWELANAHKSRVQFFGVCRAAAYEPGMRRQLTTLAALTQNGNAPAEVRIETATNWVAAIKADLKSGDTIACFSGQFAERLSKSLNQMMGSNLDAPIYVLSGLVMEEPRDTSRLKDALAWLGSLGIIFGFFLLQINLQSVASGWAHSVLLLLSIILETFLILFWNSLVG